MTTVRRVARSLSAGAIVGLSSIIYAISYGALLFSGPLAPFVSYGVTIALIAAIVGALAAWVSEEKTFVVGPDSNTTSVMAGILAGLGAAGTAQHGLDLAVAHVVVASLVAGIAYFVIGRAGLAGLVRYIPFSVMAGFLTSTGWLMTSGAFNIISGTPLTRAGLASLIADPLRPELAAGIAVAAVLFALRRVPQSILIPAAMAVATLAINLFLTSGLCEGLRCGTEVWMFTGLGESHWRAPWQLDLDLADSRLLLQNLPSMLVVAFVGLLTVLLSVASLELSYKREFDLNRITRLHAGVAVASAAVGGFTGVISIGRTTINRVTGGDAWASTVAAGLCLATLLGAGPILAHVPRAALGGLVLFLGLGMMKQWLWDQRRTMSRLERGQILLILALVVNYGFTVGFAAGLLISCMIFVITYSRLPLTSLATNLALMTSSVARPEEDMETLRIHGGKALLYRLSGYVFFGSARKIENIFRAMDSQVEAVILDFSKVSGFDSSAIGVFQRILRRYEQQPVTFHLVLGSHNAAGGRALSASAGADKLQFHVSLDHAVETAEEQLLARWGVPRSAAASPSLPEGLADRDEFLEYCERREIPRGAQLCAEHETSDEIFFVVSGSLEVIKSTAAGPVRLAKLNAGAMVGELAFYTGEARTAAIVAATDAVVLVLNRGALARLRAGRPALALAFDHVVIQKISRALSQTNKLVALYK